MFQVLPTLFQTSGGDITNVPSQEGSLEDIVSALNYISSLDGTNREVDIINMSFGNESTTQELNEKLSELAKNKVLIAAAGKELGFFSCFISVNNFSHQFIFLAGVTNSCFVLWEFNNSQKELLQVSSRSISSLISGGDSSESWVLVHALGLL